ncbi:GerMN domain-containing protein [Eubacteriales bacterium OttesenSCG-928-M02]|nr:GerMN domain-containing protein [Eubacteriales bacterium OttesenSCG-928-M02]
MKGRFFCKYLAVAAMVMACVVVLMACQSQGSIIRPEEGAGKYPIPVAERVRASLHFLAEDGSFVVEERAIPIANAQENPYLEVVRQLIKGPTSASYFAVVPDGVQVQQVVATKTIAVVDIKPMDLSPQQLDVFRRAVTETLYSCARTEYAIITMDGRLPTGFSYPMERARGVFSADGQRIENTAVLFLPDVEREFALLGSDVLSGQVNLANLMNHLKTRQENGEIMLFPAQEISIASFQWLEEGIVRVNLKSETAEDAPVPDQASIAALCLTILYNLPGTAGVDLTYNGRDLYLNETPAEYIRSADVAGYRASALLVYFPARKGNGLMQVERTLAFSNERRFFLQVQNILQGPLAEDDSTITAFSAKALSHDMFLGGKQVEDLVVLDFSQAFYQAVQGMTEQEERLLTYALVNAVTERGSIARVLFTKEGEHVKYMGKSIYLYQPLYRNPGIIQRPQETEAGGSTS